MDKFNTPNAITQVVVSILLSLTVILGMDVPKDSDLVILISTLSGLAVVCYAEMYAIHLSVWYKEEEDESEDIHHKR